MKIHPFQYWNSFLIFLTVGALAIPARSDTFRWPPIRLEGTDEVEVLENVLNRLDLLSTILAKEIPDEEMWNLVVNYDHAKKKYAFVVEIAATVSEAKVAELEPMLRRAVPDVTADTETRIKELETEIQEVQKSFDPDGDNTRLNLLRRLWMVRLATKNSASGYYWTVEVKHGDNTIPGEFLASAQGDDELSSTNAIVFGYDYSLKPNAPFAQYGIDVKSDGTVVRRDFGRNLRTTGKVGKLDLTEFLNDVSELKLPEENVGSGFYSGPPVPGLYISLPNRSYRTMWLHLEDPSYIKALNEAVERFTDKVIWVENDTLPKEAK